MMEQRRKLDQALRRMMHRKLSMGWSGYRDWYNDLKGQQYIVAGAIRRMLKRQLSMAWESWQAWYADMKAQQFKLADALNRMRNRKLSAAWEKWQFEYEKAKREQYMLTGVINRLRYRKLSAAWEKWQYSYECEMFEIRSQSTIEKMLQRIRHTEMVTAYKKLSDKSHSLMLFAAQWWTEHQKLLKRRKMERAYDSWRRLLPMMPIILRPTLADQEELKSEEEKEIEEIMQQMIQKNSRPKAPELKTEMKLVAERVIKRDESKPWNKVKELAPTAASESRLRYRYERRTVVTGDDKATRWDMRMKTDARHCNKKNYTSRFDDTQSLRTFQRSAVNNNRGKSTSTSINFKIDKTPK